MTSDQRTASGAAQSAARSTHVCAPSLVNRTQCPLTVPAAGYAAYNRPKKPAPLERLNHPTACEHCGHEECVLIRAMVCPCQLRWDRK